MILGLSARPLSLARPLSRWFQRDLMASRLHVLQIVGYGAGAGAMIRSSKPLRGYAFYTVNHLSLQVELGDYGPHMI